MQSWSVPQTIAKGLQFFNGRVESTCTACCKAACDFLRTGVNLKMYGTAAGRLGVTVVEVREATESLMELLTEAAKENLNEQMLTESLTHSEPSISNVLIPVIIHSYSDINDHLRQTLASMVCHTFPTYSRLDWRLDIEVATRCAHDLCRPVVEVALHTKMGDEKSMNRFQTDVQTLNHVTSELEKALAEMKTREYRKITRHK